MKRTIRAASLCALAALVVVPASATAKPNGTSCTGTLAPGVYKSVDVPDGAVCIVSSGPLTILGGLTVGQGATFLFGSERRRT